MRMYLTGRVCIESSAGLLDERALPGLQGRVLLVHLAAERTRPVTRDELAADLWSDAPPPSSETALNAVVSKLRRALGELAPGLAMTASAGCYELRCPADLWVDLEQAPMALHEAESKLRHGDHAGAWGFANVAHTIASRPLLAGHDSEWARHRRERLRAILLRSLDCLVQVWLASGELELAADVAIEAVRLEPYREAGYRRVMAVHEAAGNRAQALRTYEECRRLLADDLGVDPAAETVAHYRRLLGDG